MVRGVAELVREVGETLAGRFGAVAVRGEISGFSRAASGHCYFGLKDADGDAAMLRCAMFRRAASLIDFAPGDGQLVEVRGRVGVYEPRGELQFVVEAMCCSPKACLPQWARQILRRAKLAVKKGNPVARLDDIRGQPGCKQRACTLLISGLVVLCPVAIWERMKRLRGNSIE